MGVDCYIMLPHDARIRDVAKVMGALAGFKKEEEKFSSGDGWHAKVHDVEVEGIEGPALPCSAHIYLRGKTIDGEKDHFVLFTYEAFQRYRGMIPRSTPFWIAMGLRLIQFFGGAMVYNDCEWDHDGPPDVVCQCPRPTNFVEDNEPWCEFQQAILDVEPITKLEIVQAAKHAAYTPDYVEEFEKEVNEHAVSDMVNGILPDEEINLT